MYGYGPTIVDVQRWAARADRDVIGMVSGQPDWDPPEALRDGLREAAGAAADEFQYPPPRGIAPLREALAASHGPGADPDRLTVTCGTVEANQLTTALAFERDAGDVALVPDPAYPYYAARVRMLGGELRRVPVGEDGRLDPERLRAAADDDVGLVVLNSPNNPTGAVYPPETVRAAVGIAEAHDAVCLSDEVYGRLDRSGRFASALAVDSEHAVVTGSVSKSMAATGLRIGYAVVPDRWEPATTMRHVLTAISASRPAQVATLRALESTDDAYYRAVRERLDDRAERMVAGLEAVGADYVDPEGAMYVFARLPGVPGTPGNTRRLVEEGGVAAMPGAAFGSALDDWLRFSLTTPRVDAAVDRIRSFVEREGDAG
jgi:aspartate/methionine/tyrosine aminotransferase